MELGKALPDVRSPVPAEAGRVWVERLAASECPALTTRRKRRQELSGASHDPIVWVEARGANVVDADGNRYVDLTSGFGVAFVGHGHPAVVAAVEEQAGRLLHALGDLHPSDRKIALLERLCGIAPWPEARVMLSLSGADAVTAALKTALLATGKPGIVAFEGSYHGLSYGPLSVSGYDARFRDPFREQLHPHVHFARWPSSEDDADVAVASLPRDWSGIGAVIFEPIQGRAGVRIPPESFLRRLAELSRAHGALLIADEVFTGIGRCGAWWRSPEVGVVPDLICAGKALGGGLPVSACLGSLEVMAAWGNPDREAIHTGTFHGDPVGCAAALATLDSIETGGLIAEAVERGAAIASALRGASLRRIQEVRQVGMMLGLQLEHRFEALTLTRALLERGYLVLPAGPEANVLQLTPPITLTARQLEGFIDALANVAGGS